jgi:hypothetical protein
MKSSSKSSFFQDHGLDGFGIYDAYLRVLRLRGGEDPNITNELVVVAYALLIPEERETQALDLARRMSLNPWLDLSLDPSLAPLVKFFPKRK